jgi:hypothetical protein
MIPSNSPFTKWFTAAAIRISPMRYPIAIGAGHRKNFSKNLHDADDDLRVHGDAAQAWAM